MRCQYQRAVGVSCLLISEVWRWVRSELSATKERVRSFGNIKGVSTRCAKVPRMITFENLPFDRGKKAREKIRVIRLCRASHLSGLHRTDFLRRHPLGHKTQSARLHPRSERTQSAATNHSDSYRATGGCLRRLPAVKPLSHKATARWRAV